MPPALTVKDFYAHVDRSAGPLACWPWTGGRMATGYGRFGRGYAHRAAVEIRTGRPIPSGLSVCHHCDNPPCVNHRHLFLGTAADNMRDRNAKGRQARGHRVGAGKLTEAQVLDARARYRFGSRTQGSGALAREHGVSKETIRQIIARETWRHI